MALFTVYYADSKTNNILKKLHTPPALWRAVSDLVAKACDAGLRVRCMDLLIAAVCIHHDAAFTAFNARFGELALLCDLRIHLLIRFF